MSLNSKKSAVASRMGSGGGQGSKPKFTQIGKGGQGKKPNYDMNSSGGKGKKPNYIRQAKGKGVKPAFKQVGQAQDFKGKYDQ